MEYPHTFQSYDPSSYKENRFIYKGEAHHTVPKLTTDPKDPEKREDLPSPDPEDLTDRADALTDDAANKLDDIQGRIEGLPEDKQEQVLALIRQLEEEDEGTPPASEGEDDQPAEGAETTDASLGDLVTKLQDLANEDMVTPEEVDNAIMDINSALMLEGKSSEEIQTWFTENFADGAMGPFIVEIKDNMLVRVEETADEGTPSVAETPTEGEALAEDREEVEDTLSPDYALIQDAGENGRNGELMKHMDDIQATYANLDESAKSSMLVSINNALSNADWKVEDREGVLTVEEKSFDEKLSTANGLARIFMVFIMALLKGGLAAEEKESQDPVEAAEAKVEGLEKEIAELTDQLGKIEDPDSTEYKELEATIIQKKEELAEAKKELATAIENAEKEAEAEESTEEPTDEAPESTETLEDQIKAIEDKYKELVEVAQQYPGNEGNAASGMIGDLNALVAKVDDTSVDEVIGRISGLGTTFGDGTEIRFSYGEGDKDQFVLVSPEGETIPEGTPPAPEEGATEGSESAEVIPIADLIRMANAIEARALALGYNVHIGVENDGSISIAPLATSGAKFKESIADLKRVYIHAKRHGLNPEVNRATNVVTIKVTGFEPGFGYTGESTPDLTLLAEALESAQQEKAKAVRRREQRAARRAARA